MYDNLEIKNIADKCIQICSDKLLQYNKSGLEISFTPNDRYTDSFIRFERKPRSWFRGATCDPNSPVQEIAINITFKPGIIKNEWVGYTVYLANVDKNPKLEFIRLWPEDGGEFDEPKESFTMLKEHLLELLNCPLAPELTTPPRQAPEGMF